MRGGDCLKYFKRGWNRTEGRGYKDFRRGGGKLGQGVVVLKKGGGGVWNPLTNYVIMLGLLTHLNFVLVLSHYIATCNTHSFLFLYPNLHSLLQDKSVFFWRKTSEL